MDYSEDRAIKLEAAKVAFREYLLPMMKKKAELDKSNPNLLWARSFANRPIEFIAEIMGREWYGPDWLPWRVFVKTAFGLRLKTPFEYRIYNACTEMVDKPPRKQSKEIWVPVGRRGGKSRVFALLAVHIACCYNWNKYLVPGERGNIPVLAESRERARQVMDYIKAALAHPKLTWFVERELGEEVFLRNNLMIRVSTASIAAVRSRTVVAAICDEIAFWPKDESANPDRDILGALRPAMVTIPDSMLLCASSPYGRSGVLWEAYEKYFGKPWDGRNLVWQAPTEVMHPSLKNNEEIKQAYIEDPISAAAEYGAQFRVDVDAFISKEVLDPCIVRGVREIPPQKGIQYYAFVDPSGGSSDSMTLAIGHRDMHTDQAVIDCLREVRAPFSPEQVVGEFSNTLLEYEVWRVRGDYYGGEWPRNRFKAHGVDYQISKRNKSVIYLEFLPFLNAGRCQLLDDTRSINQLLNLERKTARGGRDSIDHYPGTHDDLANVVAGVIVEILGRKDMMNVAPDLLAKSAAIVTRRQYF